MKNRFMMTIIITTLMVAGSFGNAEAMNKFQNLTAHESNDDFNMVFEFEKKPSVKIRYFENLIQFEIKNAFIMPSRKSFELNHGGIKNVNVYQFNKNTLRIRLIPSSSNAEISKRISFDSQGNKLVVKLIGAVGLSSIVEDALPVTTPKTIPASDISQKLENKLEDVHTEPLPKETVVEKTVATPKKPAPVAKVKNLLPANTVLNSASDVPGFLKYEEPKTEIMPSIGSSIVKVVSALFIVLALVLFIGYIARTYMNKIEGKFGGKKDLKVLSNHFIGVKKNVTIIEVCGEIMVLGVTNSNINLLAHYSEPNKIEQFKLNNRLPATPIGVAKKIPGMSWGVSAKQKISQKFAKTVDSFKESMEEKPVEKNSANNFKEKLEASLTLGNPDKKPPSNVKTRKIEFPKEETLANRLANDIISKIKTMQEATAS